MLVPIYVDFGKGWQRLGSANIVGNATVELGNLKLPQAAKRAAICALTDVLALNITKATQSPSDAGLGGPRTPRISLNSVARCGSVRATQVSADSSLVKVCLEQFS